MVVSVSPSEFTISLAPSPCGGGAGGGWSEGLLSATWFEVAGVGWPRWRGLEEGTSWSVVSWCLEVDNVRAGVPC